MGSSSLRLSKAGVFNADDDEEEEEEEEEEGGRKRRPSGKVVQFFPWTMENTCYMLSADNSLGMGGGG